jgi:hypothetical protein
MPPIGAIDLARTTPLAEGVYRSEFVDGNETLVTSVLMQQPGEFYFTSYNAETHAKYGRSGYLYFLELPGSEFLAIAQTIDVDANNDEEYEGINVLLASQQAGGMVFSTPAPRSETVFVEYAKDWGITIGEVDSVTGGATIDIVPTVTAMRMLFSDAFLSAYVRRASAVTLTRMPDQAQYAWAVAETPQKSLRADRDDSIPGMARAANMLTAAIGGISE